MSLTSISRVIANSDLRVLVALYIKLHEYSIDVSDIIVISRVITNSDSRVLIALHV